MANATPTRLGQRLGAGATNDLWLTQFGGEVLKAFESKKIMRGLIRNRRITNGETAQFPAIFKAWANYHTPGAELTGQDILKNDITLTADDLLVADTYVAKIDELKNHYDVRAPFAKELGNAIARVYDVMGSQSVAAAAYGTELFPGDGAGKQLAETGTQDFATSGLDLVDALTQAKLMLEEDDVETDDVSAIFRPLQFSLIANSEKNVNRDYGGDGARDPGLDTMSGVRVHKSNALMFGRDVTPYDETTNPDGLVGHPTDVRRMPALFPSKYHRDMSNVAGLVFTADAAGILELLGINTETTWDARRRATLLIAEMAAGAGPMRNKCAVALETV